MVQELHEIKSQSRSETLEIRGRFVSRSLGCVNELAAGIFAAKLIIFPAELTA